MHNRLRTCETVVYDFNKAIAEDEVVASEGENDGDKNDASDDELEDGADEFGDEDEFDEEDDGTGPTIKVNLVYPTDRLL